MATQRLAGAPLATPTDAVRLLCAVQAQDNPLASWSLATRSRARTLTDVRADQARGGFVRVHALRPTWHLVASEDLRWIQRLTGPAVLRGMAGRHRGLGLDDATVARAMAALEGALAGPTPLSRRELTPLLDPGEGALRGQRVGHLLATAEFLGLICSGPPDGATHTYALVDEVVAAHPDDDMPRDEAIARLVMRFFHGHGPASDRDMARWCSLTLTEVRAGIGTVGRALESFDLDGETLWFDPSAKAVARSAPAAMLLPTFDEAALTHRTTGFPRACAEADRRRLVAEQGGGIVVVGTTDVGTFTRSVDRGTVRVTIRRERELDDAERDAVARAAGDLAAFHEGTLALDVAGPRGG